MSSGGCRAGSKLQRSISTFGQLSNLSSLLQRGPGFPYELPSVDLANERGWWSTRATRAVGCVSLSRRIAEDENMETIASRHESMRPRAGTSTPVQCLDECGRRDSGHL